MEGLTEKEKAQLIRPLNDIFRMLSFRLREYLAGRDPVYVVRGIRRECQRTEVLEFVKIAMQVKCYEYHQTQSLTGFRGITYYSLIDGFNQVEGSIAENNQTIDKPFRFYDESDETQFREWYFLPLTLEGFRAEYCCLMPDGEEIACSVNST